MGVLRVVVIRASGLADTDKVGKSDPFVVVSLGSEEKKTKVADSLNPTWNEEFSFNNASPNDVLHLQVYDKDVVGKDDLGRGDVSLSSLREGATEERQIRLKGDGQLFVAITATGMAAGGANNQQLNVTVRRAEVKDGDLIGGQSDPYVIIKIGDQQYKTKTVKGDNTPEWNETFGVRASPGDKIEFEVFDKDKFTKDDLLAEAHITIPAEYFNGQTHPISAPLIDKKGKPGGTLYVDFGASGARPGSSLGGSSGGGSYGSRSHVGGAGGSGGGGGGRAEVTVVRAEGLKKKDLIGKNDVYVVLLADGQKWTTKVSEGSNPVWNERFQLESSATQMQVEMYDKDKIGKDDKLASFSVELRPGTQRLNVPDGGYLELSIQGGGGQHGSGGGYGGRYGNSNSAGQRRSGNLVVRVVRADNVQDADLIGGKSDVFVALTVRDQEQKTETKRGTQHPMWNRSFSFTVNTEVRPEGWAESDDVLEIKICDKDLIGKDILGEGVIALKDLRRGIVETRQIGLKKGGGVLHLELLAEDFGRDRHASSGAHGYGAPFGTPMYGHGGPFGHSQYGQGGQGGHGHGGQGYGGHGHGGGYGGGGGYGSGHGHGGGYGGGGGRVEVWLKSGENLKDTDRIGKGDPYVVFRCNGQEKKSKVISGTPDPFWNEKFHFDCSPDDQIFVEVYDKDRIGKDDRLGSGVIEGREIFSSPRVVKSIPCGQGRINLELSQAGGGSGGGGGASFTPGGSRNGNLVVRVLRAENVADADKIAGKSDVFVTLSCNGSEQKTDVKDGPNPMWNRSYAFTVPLQRGHDTSMECNDMLRVQVHDKDLIGKDLLGEGALSLRELRRGQVEHRQISLKKQGVLYLELMAEDFGSGHGRPSSPYGTDYNSYSGGMSGGGAQPRAKVFVTIDRLSGIPRDGSVREGASVYLVLTLGDQSLQTRNAVGNYDGEATWNEEFSCAVLQPEGLLRLQLYAQGGRDGSMADTLIGEATLLIQRFRGGFVHRLVVPLSSGYGGKLYMELCVASYAASLLTAASSPAGSPAGASFHSSPLRPSISPPVRPSSPYASWYSRPTSGMGLAGRPSSPLMAGMSDRPSSPYMSRIPPVGRISPSHFRGTAGSPGPLTTGITSPFTPTYFSNTATNSNYGPPYRPTSPGHPLVSGVGVGGYPGNYESTSTSLQHYYKRTTHSPGF